MRYTLLTIILITMVVLLNACKNKFQNIEIPSNAFLVDVRTPKEFKSGSVPGAINIPLDEIADALDKFEGKNKIIVFCRSGNRSGKAQNILQRKGLNNVVNGGSWKNVLSNLNKQKK